MTNSTNDRDDELLRRFGEVAAEVMQRGLSHARADDPNSFTVANRMLRSPGAAFELRVSLRPGSLGTIGYVIDDAGEPIARVFEITARAAAPQQH